MLRYNRVLVTGGTGMLGSCFNQLNDGHKFILVGSKDYDLTDRDETLKMIDDIRPDAIIHLAARVGGVKGNSDFVADFYSQNMMINTNVLEAACINRNVVEKVVSLLSTCVYPDAVDYPLTEDQVHNGEPHHSNFGYAYAKRMLDIQSRACRKQYGCNFVTAIPNNLYGKNDNFDLINSHVVPAIIRKVYEASLDGSKVSLWGDGSPLREFTYAPDIAAALSFILENYDDSTPVNIGNTDEVSIKGIAYLICDMIGYDTDGLIWDSSMPTGQMRKPSSNSRFLELGWKESNYTDLHEGLSETCRWFVQKYPDVRGSNGS